MRNRDSILLESIYMDMLLLEDEQSRIREAENILITGVLGIDFMRVRQKTQEQLKKMEHARFQVRPILDGLRAITNAVKDDRFETKNSHLPQLANFYNQTHDLESIRKWYLKYATIDELKVKKKIAHIKDFEEWKTEVKNTPSSEDIKTATGGVTTGNDDDDVKDSKILDIKADENTIYEDDEIIVFLANDVTNPFKSIQNCKKYGKGTEICIASSTSDSHYHDYRTGKQGGLGELTTYFVWFKKEKIYILIDRNSDGDYSYNDIRYNSDIKVDSEGELLKRMPQLKGAVENDVFKFIPIEGYEKHFYDNVRDAKSILDLDEFKDRMVYASIKSIKPKEWDEIPRAQLPHILRANIETTNQKIPDSILKRYPKLWDRYNYVTEKFIIKELTKFVWNHYYSRDNYYFNKFQTDMFLNDKNPFEVFGEKYRNSMQDLLNKRCLNYLDLGNLASPNFRENLLKSIIENIPALKISDEVLSLYPELKEKYVQSTYDKIERTLDELEASDDYISLEKLSTRYWEALKENQELYDKCKPKIAAILVKKRSDGNLKVLNDFPDLKTFYINHLLEVFNEKLEKQRSEIKVDDLEGLAPQWHLRDFISELTGDTRKIIDINGKEFLDILKVFKWFDDSTFMSFTEDENRDRIKLIFPGITEMLEIHTPAHFKSINFPDLEVCRKIVLVDSTSEYVAKFDKLKKCREILIFSEFLTLPSLKECHRLYLSGNSYDEIKVYDFPELEKCKNVYLNSEGGEVRLPKLKPTDNVKLTIEVKKGLKKLVIPKESYYKVIEKDATGNTDIYKTVQIVHPKDDVKLESFKKFVKSNHRIFTVK